MNMKKRKRVCKEILRRRANIKKLKETRRHHHYMRHVICRCSVPKQEVKDIAQDSIRSKRNKKYRRRKKW